MANKHRYTADEVSAALRDAKGMVYVAARHLGCSGETVANYCKRYPSVQAAKDGARGMMIDTAELKLWEAIHEGQAWAIAFCLKTLGKERGYVERQELAGTGGEPMVIKVVYEE